MKLILMTNISSDDPRLLKVLDRLSMNYQYAFQGCWFIRTSRNIESWGAALQVIVEKDEKYIFVEHEPHATNGWLSTSTWNWVNSTRY